jgi:hypothetical protein
MPAVNLDPCGHRRFPFLFNPGHSSKPRLVDVRPLLRSIRLFPNALRRRASMPRQSRRQLPPCSSSPPFLKGTALRQVDMQQLCRSYRKGLRQIRDPVHLEPAPSARLPTTTASRSRPRARARPWTLDFVKWTASHAPRSQRIGPRDGRQAARKPASPA